MTISTIHALHTCTCMSHRICRREACFPYDNNPGRMRRLCHIHHMLAAQPRAQLGQLMYPRIAAPSPPNGPIPPSKNTAHIAVRRTSCRSQRRHCRPVPTGGIAPKRSHKEKIMPSRFDRLNDILICMRPTIRGGISAPWIGPGRSRLFWISSQHALST